MKISTGPNIEGIVGLGLIIGPRTTIYVRDLKNCKFRYLEQ